MRRWFVAIGIAGCGGGATVPHDAPPAVTADAPVDSPSYTPDGERLASYLGGLGFAIVGDHVYIAHQTFMDAHVLIDRVPISGGPPTSFTTSPGYAGGRSLAADATQLYWTAKAQIYAAPFATGSATEIYSGSNDVAYIDVDAGNVFFGDYDMSQQTGSLNKITTAGAGEIKLADTPQSGVIAHDATDVFIGGRNGAILRAARDGSGAMALTAQLMVPWWVTTDATYVYWADSWAGVIQRTRKDGTGATETIASGESDPLGIAVDDTYVYWATYLSEGEIRRAPIGGGPVTILAQHEYSPTGLRLDGGYLYWVNEDDNYPGTGRGGLFRLAVP